MCPLDFYGRKSTMKLNSVKILSSKRKTFMQKRLVEDTLSTQILSQSDLTLHCNNECTCLSPATDGAEYHLWYI